MRFLRRRTRRRKQPDYFLIAAVFLLTVAGLAILTSASSELGSIRFGDSYYYLKHQLLNGLLVGLAGFVIAASVPYRSLKKVALLFFVFTLVLTALVFTNFGVEIGGARRWVGVGSITFQPSEILKLSFILYLAALFSHARYRRKKSKKAQLWSGFVPFLVASGLVAGILLAQPSTSMVVILLVAGGLVYFVSGAPARYLLAGGLITAVLLAAVIYITPYRLERIAGYLNPTAGVQAENYHRTQAMIAIGSGGVTGVGFGESPAKLGYLPAVVDDSIFAVVGQELGFIGAGLLVALFAVLVLRIFWLAHKSSEPFGRLILVGFGGIIAFQAALNIAAISGLVPLTGVPLPFVSYGGTALATFLTMSGLVVNVSRS